MNTDLTGRNAQVCGASRGIGAATGINLIVDGGRTHSL